MTATTIVTMVLILGVVWGGLALIIATATRKEGAKGGPETPEGP